MESVGSVFVAVCASFAFWLRFVPELRMGFAVFAEVSFVVFLSGFAAVSSALLLGFVCGPCGPPGVTVGLPRWRL